MTTASPTPDFTHLAIKPSERLAIVEHVHQTPGLQETDYLEWKSGYDLSERPGAAAAARQLIGMANRDGAQAMRHADGHAYVLIGVEPGNVPGVATWDSSDVENWLTRFVGADLRYDIHYVPYGGAHVLFLTIDAEREGDPIYVLQKASSDPLTGKSLDAGTIYVRHGANTAPTTPDDVRRLTARASAQPRTMLDLGVELDASKVSVIEAHILSADFRDERLADWRKEMLAAMPRKEDGHVLRSVESLTERRSRKDYADEVELHVQTIKSAEHWWWAAIAEKWLDAGRSALEVSVVNRSEDNYEDTVVELTFPLPRFCVYLRSREVEEVMKPPKWPRKWGTTLADIISPRNIVPALRAPEPEIERVAKMETLVRYPELRVRPKTTHTLKPPLLLALAPTFAGKSLPVRWRVTASNTQGDLSGEVELKVPSEPVKAAETGEAEEKESAA